MKKLTRKFEIVTYQYGLLSDIPSADFINQVMEQEPEYDLFQIISGSYWAPGGTEHWFQLVLKRK